MKAKKGSNITKPFSEIKSLTEVLNELDVRRRTNSKLRSSIQTNENYYRYHSKAQNFKD